MDLGYDSADEEDTDINEFSKDEHSRWGCKETKELGTCNRISLFFFVDVPLAESEMTVVTKLVGQVNRLFNDTYLFFESLKSPLHVSLSQNILFQDVEGKDKFSKGLKIDNLPENSVQLETKTPYLFQSMTSKKVFLSIRLGGESLICLSRIVGQINRAVDNFFTDQAPPITYSSDNLHVSIGVFDPTTKISPKQLDEFNKRLLRWDETRSATTMLFPEIWLSSVQCSTIGV